MGTSKEYIKMCEQVDLGFEFNIGDLVFLDNKIQPVIYANHEHHMIDNSWDSYIKVPSSLKLFTSEEAVPIYRQDQLQEMITDNLHNMVHKFFNFCMNYDRNLEEYKFYTDVKQFTSMEQLWLAFVMKEKYNKLWNGKEWIND